ncbi:MAG: glycine cleavage system protein H [Bacteroidales bacterium]|nr:glycine cleavage system protein H [Bacteroidales bacterium]
MDGFSYSNIFETKGIEYLAVIAFFAILIPFWIILNKKVKRSKQFQKRLGVLTASVLRVPQGLFYSKNHTWAHLEVSGVAKVGLDDLLLHITGEVKFSNLKKSGDQVCKGDILTEIVRNGKQLNILSPISGEILNTNSMLNENFETVNQDPYGKGWIYKIKPTNWIAETNSYYLAEEATNWSARELVRFKDFITVSMKKYSAEPALIMLQDGGELCDNPISELPNELWQDFQKDFLNQPF